METLEKEIRNKLVIDKEIKRGMLCGGGDVHGWIGITLNLKGIKTNKIKLADVLKDKFSDNDLCFTKVERNKAQILVTNLDQADHCERWYRNITDKFVRAVLRYSK
jgi:hypothetical protein